jgi:preprotein translocase subunit YajC
LRSGATERADLVKNLRTPLKNSVMFMVCMIVFFVVVCLFIKWRKDQQTKRERMV